MERLGGTKKCEYCKFRVAVNATKKRFELNYLIKKKERSLVQKISVTDIILL